MKQDRGLRANRWAGLGNTWLFIAVLGFMLYLMFREEYEFAMAVALAGIYSEQWNKRVSAQHFCETCRTDDDTPQ